MPTTLEIKFHNAMEDIYRRAKEEVGYNAAKFRKMVADLGGVETAKRLINASGVSDGYTALWEEGRLDLTVEAMLIDGPEFHPLFTEDELDICRKRLKEYSHDI